MNHQLATLMAHAFHDPKNMPKLDDILGVSEKMSEEESAARLRAVFGGMIDGGPAHKEVKAK